MPTRVFISYAHESEELSNAVFELSGHLRKKGIDSEIDQYEESPPEGWPKWMMRQVQQAEYVLVCCSRLFFERANDFSGEASGLGVKWETSLVLQELYTLNTNNTKYIPIIFESDSSRHIPLPLQPYTHYNVSSECELGKLTNRLLGISASTRPPLGEQVEQPEPESLEAKDRKSMFFSSIIDVELWNQAGWKGMAYISEANNLMPPLACFIYKDEQAGERIFRNLREQFGRFDESEEIRLSFVKDPTDEYPHRYVVHFGSSREVLFTKLESYGLVPVDTLLMVVTRLLPIDIAGDPKSLAAFRRSYEALGVYGITNALSDGAGYKPCMENIIGKHHVHFREKEEVLADRNDEDHVVFSESSDGT